MYQFVSIRQSNIHWNGSSVQQPLALASCTPICPPDPPSILISIHAEFLQARAGCLSWPREGEFGVRKFRTTRPTGVLRHPSQLHKVNEHSHENPQVGRSAARSHETNIIKGVPNNSFCYRWPRKRAILKIGSFFEQGRTERNQLLGPASGPVSS